MPAGARPCAFVFPGGRRCKAPPLRDGEFCRMHEPALAAEVQEGRKHRGQQRRKEAVLATAFDVGELRTVEEIRRLLVIGQFELLAPQPNVPKVRAIIALAHEAASLLKSAELEERIAALEAAVQSHRHDDEAGFDFEPTTLLDDGGGDEP